MSVNINVNGKYIKNSCQRHDLLIDPDRHNKEIESDRRKMRIQQVRNLSKNIAKEVRTNVELEKENQFKKIEEIKAQEMQMWRQNIFSQKEKNFRSAIFEVGSAHRAAQTHNKRAQQNGIQREKSFKPLNKINTQRKHKSNVLKNANAQTDITGNSYPKSGEILNSNKHEKETLDSENISPDTSTSSTVLENESEEIDTSTDTSKIEKEANVLNIQYNKALIREKSGKSPPINSNTFDKEMEPQSTSEEVLTASSTSNSPTLRFTQISDIIHQQKHSNKTQQPTNSRTSSTQTFVKSYSNHSTNTRVHFYDYNNKFHKQYDQPTSAVEAHAPSRKSGMEADAMELAALEIKSRQSREVEMHKLRQRSTERCQKAIEREQIRRSCEELTAKLDALAKQRQIITSDAINHLLPSYRLHQITKDNETNLNNAIEDIIKRPAIITCPAIERPKIEVINTPIPQPNPESNLINLESAYKPSGNNSLNSSDSCCSILLGYVYNQSKQIVNDIQHCKEQNLGKDSVKAEKLQSLLNRINKLRESLMKELQNCPVEEGSDTQRMQVMMDSIKNLRKEHEKILIDNTGEEALKIREKKLKKKEDILEKRLREFYEIQTAAIKKTLPNKSESQAPIQQNQSMKTSNSKSKDFRIEEKEAKKDGKLEQDEQLIDCAQESVVSEESEECVGQQQLLVRKNPVEIIIKIKGKRKTNKSNKMPLKSPRKLSTLIQSPVPKKLRKKCTTLKSNDSNSTSYRSLPSQIHNNVNKILQTDQKNSHDHLETYSEPIKDEGSDKLPKKRSNNLNPLLAHYVQRLLGMSRTSISALGVSSSEIETPSDSIVNTTTNLSAAETERIASTRLETAQKFILDKYNFIDELEESLRHSIVTDCNSRNAQIAWKSALKENTNKNKYKEVKNSSLKKTCKPHKSHVRVNKDSISCVDKATQMKDNCTQRIAELTEMIRKVRKEKQKILETTLSSASENGRNSTQYLDLPECPSNSDESSGKILDSRLIKHIDNLPAQSPDIVQNLEKNKASGMSRDSGISLSRPVQDKNENPFDDSRQIQSSTESLSGQIKKPKPPISISRYSPQLPEDIPHELSTIFEVDMPATSRLSALVHGPNTQAQSFTAQTNDYQAEQIAYKKFPSFEQYARINNLDMTQFDPEFTIQLEKEFNEYISLTKERKDDDSLSNCISSPSENKDSDLLPSLKLNNLSFKKFPTLKEYLNKIGVTNSDLLDSQSLNSIEKSKHLTSSNSSTTSSLINIENEFRLRNILQKPCQQHPPKTNEEASMTCSSTILHKKMQNEISGIEKIISDGISTDEQSTNVEEGLKKIGIKWPSVMKKKRMETEALSSSTSSNLEQSLFNSSRKFNNIGQISENNSLLKQAKAVHDTTTQTEDGGHQLNLREFLKKELLKRTATSSSISYSGDSVASSILRSILGSITPADRKQQSNNEAVVPTLDRLKTSTPMASQSMSSVKIGTKSQKGTSTIQLFSGESRLSSVHFNTSSIDALKTANHDE